jgi:hypothetical protein
VHRQRRRRLGRRPSPCSKPGDSTRPRAKPPGIPWRSGAAFALLAILQGAAPGVAGASIAIVPDAYPTVQAAVDTYADTVLVGAGVYAESVMVLPQDKPVVLMADPEASPRPTLHYLKLWANRDHEGDIKVVGLRITTPLVIWSHSVSARYDFEACTFEAGLGHGGIWIDYDHAGAGTSLVRCLIRGGTALTAGPLTMESDTLEAGNGASFTTQVAWVRNCWFRGPGAGIGLGSRSPIDCTISGNVFEDCTTAINVYDDYNSSSVSIENNVIRRSNNWGIWIAHAEYVDILRNDVRDGGGGIGGNLGHSRVIGNTVIGGTRGISLSIDAYGPIEIRDNLLLRCAGTGIALTGAGDEYGEYFVTGNTSALNEGAGYALALSATVQCDLSRNIAYGNAVWGLSWTGPAVPTVGCNDWFANTAGSTSGVAPGATDLSVDPIFCDVTNDDLRLRGNSPLLGGSCGTIGARGYGCHAPTVLYLARFAAEIFEQGVCVLWRLAGDGVEEPVSVWVERSTSQLGPWQRIATDRAVDGEGTIDWDRSIPPGDRYWYRLVWTSLDEQTTRSSPVQAVIAPTAAAFTLRSIGPNPMDGALTIEYTLQRSATIELTVHDIMGRECARIASGFQTQGLHIATWSGEARGQRVHPGIYFVGLSWPDGRQFRRILVRR